MATAAVANNPSTGGGAPITVGYWVATADATLSGEVAMGALATGVVLNTTTTGVPVIATLSGLTLSTGTLSNDLLTATSGSKTVVGGSASTNNLTLSSNPSQDGLLKFGTNATASNFTDTTTALGRECWNFNSGKNSGAERQVATFSNRGNAVGDDASVGFGGTGTTLSDGALSLSKVRIRSTYNDPSTGQDLRFYISVTGTSTEVFKLDGVNGTINLMVNTSVTEAKNFVFGTSTGTKFGTGTTQKMAFWNATPVAQQARPTDAATIITTGTTLGLWA